MSTAHEPTGTATAVNTDFDAEQWAREFNKSPHKKACQTCELQDIARIVKTIVTLKATDQSNVGWHDIFRMLKEVYNYPRGLTALMSHVRRCLPELYAQCRDKTR